MKKLLIICGPTATGKTQIALHLAKKLDGELLSADSRQVYKGMDIGTGKDIPKNFKFQISNFKFRDDLIGCYKNSKTKIWGLDIVNPDYRFNLGEYKIVANKVIAHIEERGKLPIVVGGTGLYIKALIEPLTWVTVPQDQKLRNILESMTLDVLQTKLRLIHLERWDKMNQSDRQNPRRLIRAIEIGIEVGKALKNNIRAVAQKDILTIGLTASMNELKSRIEHRVEKRITQGMQDEVRRLLAQGYDWNMTSMSGLGYKEWKPFFEISNGKYQISKRNKEKIVIDIFEKWKLHEYQYAKRQVVWFKKQKINQWFDITIPDHKKQIVETVMQWYTT